MFFQDVEESKRRKIVGTSWGISKPFRHAILNLQHADNILIFYYPSLVQIAVIKFPLIAF